VGSPVERWRFSSIVLRTSLPRSVISLGSPVGMLGVVVSCDSSTGRNIGRRGVWVAWSSVWGVDVGEAIQFQAPYILTRCPISFNLRPSLPAARSFKVLGPVCSNQNGGRARKGPFLIILCVLIFPTSGSAR
jgi:hypothetical protein